MMRNQASNVLTANQVLHGVETSDPNLVCLQPNRVYRIDGLRITEKAKSICFGDSDRFWFYRYCVDGALMIM